MLKEGLAMKEDEVSKNIDFMPKILGILCHWCAYAGGDLAGVSRLQYPPSLRVIRIMCTGRVESAFLIEGFLKGVDGIWVGG